MHDTPKYTNIPEIMPDFNRSPGGQVVLAHEGEESIVWLWFVVSNIEMVVVYDDYEDFVGIFGFYDFRNMILCHEAEVAKKQGGLN